METEKAYSFLKEDPALTSLNAPDSHLTDVEYLRLAARIAVKCDITKNVEERDACYRIEFYLENTTLSMDFTDDFLHVLRASDMYTFSVIKSKPEIIKLTCYRTKK